MNRILCLLALFLFSGVSVFAQQDPNDPGIQDSVIIGTAHVDSGGTTFCNIPIHVLTDDSVAYILIALGWSSPDIHPDPNYFLYPPFNCGISGSDTILPGQNYIMLHTGYSFDSTCIYNTRGVRALFTTLRFIVEPNLPRQYILLDTTWDDRMRGTSFALNDGLREFTPGIQSGYIAYGIEAGIEDNVHPPLSFSLSQNYPNPFNPSTNISFSLIESGTASLTIYDLLGRQVRQMFNKSLDVGSYQVTWDGKNEAGADVPSGTYFYRLTTVDKTETKRMMLIR